MTDQHDSLTELNRQTRADAAYLRARGVTPTLGMLVTNHTSQLFLDEIAHAAHDAGVDLRVVNIDDPSPLDPWKRPTEFQRLLERAFRQEPPATGHTHLPPVGHHRPDERQRATHHDSTPDSQAAASPEHAPINEFTRVWLRARRLDRLRRAVRVLADDNTVHAIVWAPPFPGDPDTRAEISSLIPADRDVDGLQVDQNVDAESSPAAFVASSTATLTETAANLYASDGVRNRARSLLLLGAVKAAKHRNPSIPPEDATS